MPLRSTAAAGVFSNPATWGGTLPNADDQIAVDHALTLDGIHTVGTSPDGSTLEWAVNVGPTGSIIFPLGTELRHRGPVIVRNTASQTTNLDALDFQGGWLRVDSTLAAAPASTNYRIQIGDTTWNMRRFVGASGGIGRVDGSAASYINAVGGGACFDVGAAFVFDALGTPSTPALAMGGRANTQTIVRALGATFRGCGRVTTTGGSAWDGSSTCVIEGCTFIDGIDASGIDLIVQCNGNTTGTKRIADNAFGGTLDYSGAGGLTVQRNSTRRRPPFTAPAAATVYEDNFIVLHDGGSDTGRAPADAPWREYRVIGRSIVNVKAFTFLSGRTCVARDGVLEPLGLTGSDGEYFACGALNTSGNEVDGYLLLPHRNGVGMRWGEFNGGGTGARITVRHTTGPLFSAALGYAHAGDTNQPDKIRSRGLLFFAMSGVSTTTATKIGAISGEGTASDFEDQALPEHNGENASWGTLRANRYGGTTGAGYWARLSPTQEANVALMGAGDLDGVHPFSGVDPTRRLHTWAQTVLGIAGGGADPIADREDRAINAIAVRHLGPGHPLYPSGHPDYVAGVSLTGASSPLAWVREGWRPTALEYSTVISTGRTRGAMPYQAPAPTITGVTTDPTSVTREVGQTVDLTVTITGSGGPGTTITPSWVGAARGTVALLSGGGTLVQVWRLTTTSAGTGTLRFTATDDPDATDDSADVAVTVTAPAATVTGVTVSPSAPTVSGGATQSFSATVQGTNSPSQAVTWATTGGTITSGGVLTAPAATGSVQTLTVTATSVADPTRSGTATVTVPAATVVGSTARFLLTEEDGTPLEFTRVRVTSSDTSLVVAPETAVTGDDGVLEVPITRGPARAGGEARVRVHLGPLVLECRVTAPPLATP